jgi:hypothetical protein
MKAIYLSYLSLSLLSYISLLERAVNLAISAVSLCRQLAVA